jgi:hypothetical protein
MVALVQIHDQGFCEGIGRLKLNPLEKVRRTLMKVDVLNGSVLFMKVKDIGLTRTSSPTVNCKAPGSVRSVCSASY